MNDSKDHIRSKHKRARLNLSNEEREAKSAQVVKRLISFTDWSKIKSLHVYEPILPLGELDINDFIDYIRSNHSEIDLYTSRRVNNVWGVVPLDAGREVAVTSFDAVIVPMISFDSDLQRIGYGGGYYDKFLATQPDTQKIGICLEVGKTEKILLEAHDIAMSVIITEANIYS